MWHLRDAHELARGHGVDPAHGLHADQVAQRVLQHGANQLPGRASRSVWSLVVDQFSDFMILVLIAAAVISGVAGACYEPMRQRRHQNRRYFHLTPEGGSVVLEMV